MSEAQRVPSSLALIDGLCGVALSIDWGTSASFGSEKEKFWQHGRSREV